MTTTIKPGAPRAIPDRLYFRIGDVAEIVGVKPYVLRYWETEFPMIAPQKSASGQRVYRRSDVETILVIRHLLYVERYSIDGARRRLRELRREGELKVYLSKRVGTAPEPRFSVEWPEDDVPAAEAKRLPTPQHPRIEQAALAAAGTHATLFAHPSTTPAATLATTPATTSVTIPVDTGAADTPTFRFADLGEAMSEAQSLAELAAERALGPLGEVPFGMEGEGAVAAGAIFPVEQGTRAIEAFVSDGDGAVEHLREALRAAGDLKDFAETPIAQLYP